MLVYNLVNVSPVNQRFMGEIGIKRIDKAF